VLYFSRAELLAYTAQREPKGTGNRLLGCISDPASDGFIAHFDEAPSTGFDSFHQAFGLHGSHKIPALLKLIDRKPEPNRQLKARA
jgi:hypothetical protein